MRLPPACPTHYDLRPPCHPTAKMKAKLFACLTILTALTARAESPEEARLIQLLDDFDADVADNKPEKLKGLVLEGYTYVEPDHTFKPAVVPPPSSASLDERISRRLDREWCCRVGVPAVVVAGDTAVVTGTYRVIDRDITLPNTPRLLALGRYTTTWVRNNGDWRLLAEHRSLNDEQTWANEAAPSAETTPQAAEATGPVKPASWLADRWNQRKQARQDREVAREHRGFLPRTFTNLFRSYEPTRLGYTWDQGDDAFMDFTFSTMLPLHPAAREYPEPVRRRTDENFLRPAGYSGLNVYFAATVRSGQYIGTRPSAPVVGKRFNPMIAFRLWEVDRQGRMESEDNFVELVYAHESNGQFIASAERFNQQLQIYLDQYKDSTDPVAPGIVERTAYRSARDNISRGWDYVGLQYAHDWDAWGEPGRPKTTVGLRVKYNYYLPWGIAQHRAEEYNGWENDPEGKPRNRVDGLSFRFNFKLPGHTEPDILSLRQTFIQFVGPHSLVWTTGGARPFRYNTLTLEAGLRLLNSFPLTFWYRRGYNSDLVDYYRKDHSIGLSLSYWNF